MQTLVDEIIAPYFADHRRKLGLPETQKAIWQIDAWSVHRSEAFRAWMRKHHSNIIVQYVPAGCTGVFQPCDVGIQRILKHSLKRSYHRDVVDDISEQLDKGTVKIVLDRKLGQLRNSAVRWTWEAFETLNKKEIISKVSNFVTSYRYCDTHCKVGICSLPCR